MKLARRYGLAMHGARKVGSLLVMIGFVAFTTATSKPKKDRDRPAPLPDTPPAPTSFATPAPVDVDALFLAATLACGAKPANTGCKLLKEFDLAPAWIDLPVEPAVWFGETNAIGGSADGKKELFFVQVGSGLNGFFASARTLFTDNAKEAADAQRLLVASKAGSAVPGSEAAKFMRTTPPGGGRLIIKTRGRSQALVQTPTQVYIRSKGDRLLIVEHSGAPLGHDSSRGVGPALAWVSELFRVR